MAKEIRGPSLGVGRGVLKEEQKPVLSRRHWKSSYKKWCKIVEKTEKKTEFSSVFGFRGLHVTKRCGYCYGFSSKGFFVRRFSCLHCPLFEKKICCEKQDTNFVFWRYVFEMWSNDFNWDRALKCAKEIRDAIKEDGVQLGYIKATGSNQADKKISTHGLTI